MIKNGLIIFISGNGSNLNAILQSPIAHFVQAVLSDNPNAPGLKIAQHYNKASHIINPDDCTTNKQWEDNIHDIINNYQPQLIALAGFMRILSHDFIAQQSAKIVNIHPSLLPLFPGLKTHQRAIDANVKKHGCTIHWVTTLVDDGPIIAQSSLDVLPNDTALSLKARVQKLEHCLYPKTLQTLLI